MFCSIVKLRSLLSRWMHYDLVLVGDRLARQPQAQMFLRHVAQLASPAEFLPGRSSHTIRLFREV